MIYHVTTKSEWEKALSIGKYEAPSLFSEGFIHMSQKDQVAGVLDRYYKGVNDLVLLHVDENFLSAELKYELSPSINQEFPHLFGALNVEAVVDVVLL
jgi:uncharacterized protein (DUF952 family)